MVNGINNRGYYPNLGHSWTYPLAQYTPRDSKRENHPMAKKHIHHSSLLRTMRRRSSNKRLVGARRYSRWMTVWLATG